MSACLPVPDVNLSTLHLEIEIHQGQSECYTTDWGYAGKLPFENSYGRLYLLDSGEIRVRDRQQSWTVEPESLWLIPPRFRGYYQGSDGMRLNWIHFNVCQIPRIDIFEGGFPLMVTANPLECNQMRELAIGLGGGRHQGDLVWPARLAGLLIPFLDRVQVQGRRIPSTVEPALKEVAMYYSEPCPVARLAKRVNLHPVYFTRLFKEAVGESPARYVTRVRMHHAALRLQREREAVKVIASECGYPDPYHFSRAFKHYYGISPQAYRRLRSDMP